MVDHDGIVIAKDILMIVLPTIVGAVATRYIVNGWQEKKEKFRLDKEKYDLRMDIQERYKKSGVALVDLSYSFIERIEEEYASNWQLDSKKKTVTRILVIPEGDQNLPKILFAKELKEYRKQNLEITKNVWELFATISVYYDSKKLNDRFFALLDQAHFLFGLFYLLIESNPKEFHNNHKILIKVFDDFREDATEVTKLLADTPMKELPIQTKVKDSKIKKLKKFFKF